MPLRWFLAFQVLLIVVSPLLQWMIGSSMFVEIALRTSFIGLTIICFTIMAKGRQGLGIGLGVFVLLAILQVAAAITAHPGLNLGLFLCMATMLLFVFGRFIGYLMNTYAVSHDVLLIGISSYLLMAIFWAALYSICTLLDISSFAFSAALESLDSRLILDHEHAGLVIYYSIVTQTTLGYGDITPVSPLARLLASSQALVGQIYVAILIGRLVGLSIAEQNNGNKNGGA